MFLYYSAEIKDLGSNMTLNGMGFYDNMNLRLADRRQNIKVIVIRMDGVEQEVEYNNEQYLELLKQKVQYVGGTRLEYDRMALILERNNSLLKNYQPQPQLVNGDRLLQVRGSFTMYQSDSFLPTEDMDCITLEVPENPVDFPNCKMPCGHVFSSETIREVMLRKVRDEKAHEIRCPAIKEGHVQGICNASWDFTNLPEYFQMTNEEENLYVDMLKENIHLFVLNYIQCPTCRKLIPRPSDDPKLTRTHCDKCELTEGQSADFCYKCGEEWKYDEICLSDFCTFKKQNQVLQECIEIEVDGFTVPTVRACPNCNTLYEHMEACRHMQCQTLKCKDEEFEYCHLCLGEWNSHQCENCNIAPRQVLENPYIKQIEEVKQEEEKPEEKSAELKETILIAKDGVIEEQKLTDTHSIEVIQKEKHGEIYNEQPEQHLEVQIHMCKQSEGLSDEMIYSTKNTDKNDYNEHYEHAISIKACSIF
ncbi:hypothetical protein FGO68_gene3901 [Halteria grandinella]|uniref:RING-type domain-containing protein n=1 Tax=Halteria grandinella TaxID=5974 RepID=A0A8J8T3M0_HALGN|nr:hypothetical protein FGO68_gene3901 [Halteria grandinella]